MSTVSAALTTTSALKRGEPASSRIADPSVYRLASYERHRHEPQVLSVLLQIDHDLQVRLVHGLREVVAAGLGLTDIQEPALSSLAQVLEQPRGCVDDPLVGVALVLLEARIIVHEQAAVLAERQLPFNDLGNARHEALHFGLLGTLDLMVLSADTSCRALITSSCSSIHANVHETKRLKTAIPIHHPQVMVLPEKCSYSKMPTAMMLPVKMLIQ
jgi:hypothetical protein